MNDPGSSNFSPNKASHKQLRRDDQPKMQNIGVIYRNDPIPNSGWKLKRLTANI